MTSLMARESADIISVFVILHVVAALTAAGGRYPTWNHNHQSENHVVELARSFDHVEPGVTSPFILVAAPNSISRNAGCTAREWLVALEKATRENLNDGDVN